MADFEKLFLIKADQRAFQNRSEIEIVMRHQGKGTERNQIAHGELVGQHSSVLNTYATEERNQLLAEQTDKLRKDGAWIGEMSNRHKDGRIFTTSARLSKLDISGQGYWVCVQEDITEGLENAPDAFIKLLTGGNTGKAIVKVI